jgi:hypothetical protein
MSQAEDCIGDGWQSRSLVVALVSNNQYICGKGIVKTVEIGGGKVWEAFCRAGSGS